MLSVSNFEYSQGDLLGHGAFALVFKGKRKKDHLPVAIKQIALKSVPGKLSSIRQKEITILKDLKNTNIVQLYDYLETPSDIFLVMEYCNGGDMGDYLIAKKTLSETSIRHLTRHIALALEALYTLHIIHRDIKPQNLLLSYPHSSSPNTLHSKAPFTDATVKLADFGFARYLTGADMAATLCGSPLYMAPEILMGQHYDNSADLWSIGTILFQCLSGSAPFLANNPHALRRRYEREKLIPKIPDGTTCHLSDLLVKLLKKNPRERLSYTDFFHHKFLKNPSIFSSDPLFDSQPSQRLKSSPVPIKRQPILPSPYSSSPHHSASPHHGSSVDTSSFSPSSFSGPPLSHRVGSQASLPYYSAQSPNSDITDQGFILVDFPGGPGSRRCSISSSGSGKNSLPGHTHSSHNPSSGGSLSRYSSLTTPFYQVPPKQFQGSRGSTDQITPSNKISTNVAHSGTNSQNNFPGLNGSSPSSLVPFGKLVQAQQTFTGYFPASNASNHSSNSYNQHRKPSPVSPLSTPPSSLSSPGMHPQHPHTGGTKCIPRRSSGTKLSSLTEERERKKTARRDASESSSRKDSSGGFDIITQSCLLHSGDEEENFHLTMSLTDQEETDEGEELKYQSPTHQIINPLQSSGGILRFLGCDAVHFNPAPSPPRASSSRDCGNTPTRAKLKRAASFSHQLNPRLSQELAAIHNRASSLSAYDDSSNSNDPLNTPTRITSSPSSEIIMFKVPFLYSGSTKEESKPADKLPDNNRGDKSLSDEEEGVNLGSLKLSDMRNCLVVTEEMRAMAKARQGPILLLSTSTDLTESGIVSRQQRCTEQLVLYAKTIHLLDDMSTRYGMALALASCEDPPNKMKKMIDEIKALQKICLEEANQIRQELLHSKEKHQNLGVKVSAERLLFLEALDMCKAALLDERPDEETECIKRYRRAKIIFKHLLSDASTTHDRQILHKYMQSAQNRISHLLQ